MPVFDLILNISIKILVAILLIVGIYVFIQFSNKNLEKNEQIRLNKLKILRIIIYILSVLGISYLFKNYPILRITLFTFIASVIIAYILNPFMKFLERKNIKRLYAIIIIYITIALAIFILAIGIFPSTFKQFKNLLFNLPDMVRNFVDYSDSIRKNLFTDVPFVSQMITSINGQLVKMANTILSASGTWITGMVAGITSFIGIVIQLILIPVITFYLLLEKDKILDVISRSVPDRYETFLVKTWREIDESLSMFVRGRIIMAIFVGVATMIYLMAFGIEFSFVIGVITCVADIIPYIGPFLGFVPAVLLALFKGPFTALWVAALFCFVQWLENNILGPKILGDSTGMHPLIVLILLILGGGMFGVLGMIFSVPVAAVIKIIYKNTKPYVKKYLFKDKLEN
ncbi:putative membrane protein [Parvimonas sp. oral taxon 393 str. F0440]|nr:putative membrane protein [Parvimonas sp. oral taxon 393 str. F0440]